MKSFRFSLETVLKLKQLREEMVRMTLLQLHARQIAAERDERRLAEVEGGIAQELAENSRSALGAELRFVEDCRTLVREARFAAAESAQKIRARYQSQQAAYASAHRESEILDRLRERQLQSFQLDERRAEQRELDEIHTLRRTGPQLGARQPSITDF